MKKIFGSLDFSNRVRENAILRASFNELTRETSSGNSSERCRLQKDKYRPIFPYTPR